MNINANAYDPKVLRLWEIMQDEGILEQFFMECRDAEEYMNYMKKYSGGNSYTPGRELGGVEWVRSSLGYRLLKDVHERAGITPGPVR